jgi:hypothetical protein
MGILPSEALLTDHHSRFHRIMAFLQLLVFSGMAAFTNQFDVFGGLLSSRAIDEARAEQFQLERNGLASSVLQAQRWRSRRLPTINAKGIAITVTLSRLVMLVQYLIGMVLSLCSAESLTLAASVQVCWEGQEGNLVAHFQQPPLDDTVLDVVWDTRQQPREGRACCEGLPLAHCCLARDARSLCCHSASGSRQVFWGVGA